LVDQDEKGTEEQLDGHLPELPIFPLEMRDRPTEDKPDNNLNKVFDSAVDSFLLLLGSRRILAFFSLRTNFQCPLLLLFLPLLSLFGLFNLLFSLLPQLNSVILNQTLLGCLFFLSSLYLVVGFAKALP
jgi:hypothetical protein